MDLVVVFFSGGISRDLINEERLLFDDPPARTELPSYIAA